MVKKKVIWITTKRLSFTWLFSQNLNSCERVTWVLAKKKNNNKLILETGYLMTWGQEKRTQKTTNYDVISVTAWQKRANRIINDANSRMKNIKLLEFKAKLFPELKGVFSKPSGNLIVSPIFCFWSYRLKILATCLFFDFL